MVRDYPSDPHNPNSPLLRGCIRFRDVKLPAQTVMIWEEMGPNDAYCVNICSPAQIDDHPSGRHVAGATLNTGTTISDENRWRLAGRGNHCFFDGHVETLSPQDLFNHPEYYNNLPGASAPFGG